MAPPTPAPQAAATTTTKSVKAPTAKQYIIAALMAVLAAAIIVTVFFIMLSPARILISVAEASSHETADGMKLAMTLSVNNTSTRARVEYGSIYIDVSNSTSSETAYWIRADMAAAVRIPLFQPKLNETRIPATLFSALKGEPLMVRFFTRNMTNNAFAVTVTAVARFKVGFAQTRLYDIKVTCAPVSFFPAAAELSGVPPAPLPVLCG